MTLSPAPNPDWLAAIARAEVHDGKVTVTCRSEQRSFAPFSIAGFPCSGMDWVGRLLSLHPAVVVADSPRRLGPLGGGRAVMSREEQERASDEALRASLAAAGTKPGATHVGVSVVSGDATTFDPEIRLFRDGRDVLVAWTLRQLREEGEAMRRFLKKPAKDQYGMDNLMPGIHRRFHADPADLLERNPGLLLSDYDWVRFASHLWADDVDGHFSAMGAIEDGRLSGPVPYELYYEAARAKPLDALNDVARMLGLDPLTVGQFPAGTAAVDTLEADPELLAEWMVGRWKRYFTPKAGKLFKMDASHALEMVTGHYGDDEWEGECKPGPE